MTSTAIAVPGVFTFPIESGAVGFDPDNPEFFEKPYGRLDVWLPHATAIRNSGVGHDDIVMSPGVVPASRRESDVALRLKCAAKARTFFGEAKNIRPTIPISP